MRLFDSHAHLDIALSRDKKISQKTPEQMIESAREGGVDGIMAVAGSLSPCEFESTLAIVERHDWIWAAAGIHPHVAKEATQNTFESLRKALGHPRVLALGEVGLDYHYLMSPKNAQRAALAAQIRIARETGKPIVVHTREADDDMLSMLRDEGAERVGGVIHCFTATARFAEGALDLGFFISFSGILTFAKAEDIREVARWAPKDRILAETDTPYLTPAPFRNLINEPAMVRLVVEKLAEIRETTAEDMAELTRSNAMRCFGIPGDK